MNPENLSECATRLSAVDQMIAETVAALLRCFDYDTLRFPPSLLRRREPIKIRAPWRDSAIVLTAIDKAPARFKQDDLHKAEDVAKSRSIQSKDSDCARRKTHYERIFCACLHTIANGESEHILGTEEPDPAKFVPFEHREPFTCARILGLLNIFGSQKSHGEVYVAALCKVLEAVTTRYSPHYAFGAGSITGREPHAFVAYYCLESLHGIAVQLRTRKTGHDQFAARLRELHEWLRYEKSAARRVFGKWADYRDHLVKALESLQQVVGLEDVVKDLQTSLMKAGPNPESSAEACEQELCKAMETVLQGTTVTWLQDFIRLVKEALKTIAPVSSGGPTGVAASTKVPGSLSFQKAEEAAERGAEFWRRAFLEGMQQVLEEIVEVYQGPRTSNLPTLANKIEAAGEKWQASAKWTDKYVSKLSKWGAVEMHHQLALSSVPSRVNFDAAQLAFCLRIHYLGEASQDTEIAEKALEILLETQRTNGTWPVGAALATDFETGASIFSTNLEVIGAIAPLIKDHGGIQRHATILSRVYDWLIANRRSIEFNGTMIRGWSADYIWERGRVDVWATGLVLDFLVQYRDLIVDGMARRLRNCKYDVRLPSELKVTLRTLIDPQAEGSFDQQITRRIMADYINTFRTTGKSKNSSMVLYGPPGTSKTTFAEAIAKELEWSLVTITPSDFVQNGIERSEDMARKLFADLLDLRDVVVLFDECDEMFRDRSDTGLKDIGMLRFIVPGMLPKLQLLKKHGEEHGLIFIVATNYNERLDRAIVRPGRIDERFLVPPYDQKARACLIDGFLKGIRGLSEDVATRVDIADALAVWTAGWVFPEIKTLSDRLREKYKDFEAELKASAQDIGAFLREKLIVTGPTQALGYTFGFAPNLVRALNPSRIYDKDRKGADKERDVVVKICSTQPVPLKRKKTVSPPKTNAATKNAPAARKNAVKRAVNK